MIQVSEGADIFVNGGKVNLAVSQSMSEVACHLLAHSSITPLKGPETLNSVTPLKGPYTLNFIGHSEGAALYEPRRSTNICILDGWSYLQGLVADSHFPFTQILTCMRKHQHVMHVQTLQSPTHGVFNKYGTDPK